MIIMSSTAKRKLLAKPIIVVGKQRLTGRSCTFDIGLKGNT